MGTSDMLLSQLDDIPETNGPPAEAAEQEKAAAHQEKLASHKVKRGETLASLAKAVSNESTKHYSDQ